MTNKDFPERNIKIAEDQDEYQTVHAFANPGEGSVTMRMVLSDDEVARVQATNEVWIKLFTNNGPMQPIAMSCNKEDLITKQDLCKHEFRPFVTKDGMPFEMCLKCEAVRKANKP